MARVRDDLYAKKITEDQMICKDCSLRSAVSGPPFNDGTCPAFPKGKPVAIIMREKGAFCPYKR